MSKSSRSDQIFEAIGIVPIVHQGDEYALSRIEPGIQYSAFMRADGAYEFGVDFASRVGLQRAVALDDVLRRYGLARKDRRADRHAYRWDFPPHGDHVVNATQLRLARRVLDAILSS